MLISLEPCQMSFSQCGELPPRLVRAVDTARKDLFERPIDFLVECAALFFSPAFFSVQSFQSAADSPSLYITEQ